MDIDAYLKNRVDDQMDWFDKKSSWNQRRYKIIKVTEIILAVVIPFLAGLSSSGESWIPITIGVLGVIIAACEGLQGLYHFNEKWIQYRTTREALLQQKMLFVTSSADYNGKREESFRIFVERVENILSQENNQWKNYTSGQQNNQDTNESAE